MGPRGDVDVLLNIKGRNSDALRNIAGVQTALAAFHKTQRQQIIQTRQQQRETQFLNRLLADQRQHLKGLTLDYVAVRRALLSTGVRTAVTGFNALNSTILATGLAVEGLVGSLGKASLSLGAFGIQGFGAFAQGVGVGILALKDVGKALTQTGDQFNRTMTKLTKPAQEFVMQARGMRDAFAEVKLLAQVGLFPGLNRGFKSASTQMGNFKQIVFDTAEMLGYLAEQAGKSIQKNGVLYTSVAEDNVKTLGRLGNTAIAAFEGLAYVMDGASRSTDILSRKVLGLVRDWRDDMHRLNSDGSLDHFFLQSEHMAELWGGTLVDAVGAVVDHVRAGQPVIDEMTQSIHDAADRMHDWTSSEHGQKVMRENWERMQPVMTELAKTVGAIGKALVTMGDDGAENATRMLHGFRTEIIPLLHKMGDSLNKTVLPAFIDLVGALVDFADAIQPGFAVAQGVLSKTVGFASDLLGFTSDLIDDMPKAAKALAGLAAGPALIIGWSKFKTLLERSLLTMRQLVGLAPRLGNYVPPTGGGGGGGTGPVIVPGGGGGGRPGGPEGVAGPHTGYFRDRPVVRRTQIRRPSFLLNRSLGIIRDMQVGAGVSTATTMNTPFPGQYPYPIGPKRLTGAAADPRNWIGSQPIMGPMLGGERIQRSLHNNTVRRLALRRGRAGANVPRVTMEEIGRRRPPVEMSPSTLRPGTNKGAQTYRDFIANQGHRPSARRTRYMDNIVDAGRGIKRVTTTGVTEGIAKGVNNMRNSALIKGLFYGGALSGILGAFSSSELNKTFSQRTTNFLSGLTFGAIKGTDARASDIMSAAGLGLDKGGKFVGERTGPDHRNLIEKHGVLGGLFKKDAPSKFTANLSTVTGIKRFREEYLQTLLDGKKITQQQFDDMVDASKVAEEQIKGARLEGGKKGKGPLLIDKDDVTGPIGLIKSAFRTLKSDANLSLDQINLSVKNTGKQIKQNMVQGSDSAQSAVGRNFELAAKAIKRSMKHGVISSEEGMKAINRLLTKRLEAFGLSPHQAANYLKGGKGGTVSIYGGKEEGTTGITTYGDGKAKFARGGLTTIGSPTAAGPDNVPLNIVAGRGEDVAVFNRHQRAALDARLADTGGLKGFFAHKWPKHSQFAGGGIVRLGRRLQRMGYAVSEHPAFGGVHPVHTKGSKHYTADALDVNADGWAGGEKRALDRLAKMLGGWHVLWQVAGHFDHLHVDNGSRGRLPGRVGLPRVQTRVPGMLGNIVQAGLEEVRGAALATLSRVADSGSGGEREPRPPKGAYSRKGLSALWRRVNGGLGNAALMGRIGMAESSGNPHAHGAPDGRGLWQVEWPVWGSTFPGMNPYDPVDNARMAGQILRTQGLKAWVAYNNGNFKKFAATGFLSSAMPTQGGGVPNVNTNDFQGKDFTKKNKKKSATKKVDFTAPDLSRIKRAAKKKRKVKKLPQFVKNMRRIGLGLPDGMIPDFHKKFEVPIDDLIQKMNNFSDVSELTQEEGVLTDPVTGKEFVNWDGAKIDGKFIPGVNHRIGELEHLLAMHTGSNDGTGQAGLLGKYLKYGGAMGKGLVKLGNYRDKWRERLAELYQIWSVAGHQRSLDTEMIQTLTARPGTWQDRAATLGARIHAGQEALDSLPANPLTQHGKNEKKKLTTQMRQMREKKAKLERDKPTPSSMSKHEKAILKDARGDRRDQNFLLDAIGDSRTEWHPRQWSQETAAGRVAAKIDFITSTIQDIRENNKTLTTVDLPRERDVDIPMLISELNDWKGTHISAPQSGGTSETDALKLQQLQDQLRASTLANLQFGSLRDFAQNVGLRFLGSFAHGLTNVPETGLALVHRNETIVPDQQGPFRTGQTMGKLGGNDGNTNVAITLGFDSRGMLQIIDQRIEGKAASITSRTTGQRSRLIRAAG